MKQALVFGLAVVAGCVSSSEVVPAGRDSYMVTGSATGAMVAGQSGVTALKTANAYCARKNKYMVIRRTDTSGSFNTVSTNLVFSCVEETDPEYQRPTLRRDPTTVIEDQRR